MFMNGGVAKGRVGVCVEQRGMMCPTKGPSFCDRNQGQDALLPEALTVLLASHAQRCPLDASRLTALVTDISHACVDASLLPLNPPFCAVKPTSVLHSACSSVQQEAGSSLQPDSLGGLRVRSQAPGSLGDHLPPPECRLTCDQ